MKCPFCLNPLSDSNPGEFIWTAGRICRREAEVIPADIEFDSVGLRMGIWY